ncbi:Hypothetical predicted protein [Mytilus galloprovincialis]|uniref:RNase H type-1 domain-containing protein n=1 Tax=Mytilus galloprovincialis TaxID=29158 RepID=A0A8B6FHR1_MYTGA|nr:Hypothetical predicted protein [Mytilus galloprovincialis]
MLEEEYPSETWVRVYTDGSATNATSKGEASIYIKYPNGDQQSEAIPTGLHCANYKAVEEALTHAAHSIKNKIDNTTQVVFLTGALSATSFEERQATSTPTSFKQHQKSDNSTSVDPFTLWSLG